MASWRAEYLEALNARDRREQADVKLFQAYTRLADRTAAVEASRRTPGAQSAANRPDIPLAAQPGWKGSAARPPGTQKTSEPSASKGSRSSPSLDNELGAIRRDLVEAQRTKVDLQTRLRTSVEELDKLRVKTKNDARRISELSTARTTIATKMRDRDEELKGKAKLLDDVQDEVISLNIELTMAEKRCKELQAENQDLVARLMAWKGQEADAVNNASKFS